jgi:hypothetical protein
MCGKEDGVVPIPVESVGCNVHGGELLVGDLDPNRVGFPVEFCPDGEPFFK